MNENTPVINSIPHPLAYLTLLVSSTNTLKLSVRLHAQERTLPARVHTSILSLYELTWPSYMAAKMGKYPGKGYLQVRPGEFSAFDQYIFPGNVGYGTPRSVNVI